ncbi:MAG: SCO family protein, partial [Chitinophagaceae bacterium]
MNKNAFLGIVIALLLPLSGYFIFKSLTDNAVHMPGRYLFDSVVVTTKNGKQVTDTIWHKLPEFKLTNQLGKEVGWKDIGDKIVVADFFFTNCP